MRVLNVNDAADEMADQGSNQAPDDASIDFEDALAQLESLVEQMETGTLSLEESLRAFERGVRLARHCQTVLEQAELRVKALLQDGTEASVPDSGASENDL